MFMTLNQWDQRKKIQECHLDDVDADKVIKL